LGSAGDDIFSHSRVLNAGEELKIGSENGDDWLNIADVSWDAPDAYERLVYRSKFKESVICGGPWRTTKNADQLTPRANKLQVTRINYSASACHLFLSLSSYRFKWWPT
jgi:hypothetical protein